MKKDAKNRNSNLLGQICHFLFTRSVLLPVLVAFWIGQVHAKHWIRNSIVTSALFPHIRLERFLHVKGVSEEKRRFYFNP